MKLQTLVTMVKSLAAAQFIIDLLLEADIDLTEEVKQELRDLYAITN